MKVWVLTSEFNDYDQHGEYFEAVYASKPTAEQIAEKCRIYIEFADHILNGGGRKDKEYSWYWLREEECQ